MIERAASRNVVLAATALILASGALAGCSGSGGSAAPQPQATVTVTAEATTQATPTPAVETSVPAAPTPTAAVAFDPAGLSHGDVLVVLRDAGFAEFLDRAEDPNAGVEYTCSVIDGEVQGEGAMRSERSAWVDSLTASGEDEWGWTPERASAFVDVLFNACYDTGHATRGVLKPPSMGNGTWRVGTDIPPGTYRVAKAADYCLWYRLDKMSSGLDADAIINWGWAEEGDPVLATIEPGDIAFQSMGCGNWVKVD